jgi:hypothetical protein
MPYELVPDLPRRLRELRALTTNFGSERARFISDDGHRRRELVYVNIPAFNNMDHGARCGPKEGESAQMIGQSFGEQNIQLGSSLQKVHT